MTKNENGIDSNFPSSLLHSGVWYTTKAHVDIYFSLSELFEACMSGRLIEALELAGQLSPAQVRDAINTISSEGRLTRSIAMRRVG